MTDLSLLERIEQLKVLNRNRFDYVLARSGTKGIAEALDKIDLSKKWYYAFSEAERAEIERLADELHYAKAIKAQLILADATDEAAEVKRSGLRSRDERIRQSASTEILDRTVGRPVQRNENKTELTGELHLSLDDTLRKIYGPGSGA